VRYPHILTVSWNEPTTFDSHGMPVAGDSVSHTIRGRAEANGKGSLVRTDDGAQIVYDWSFFSLPVSFQVPFGAKVVLSEGEKTIWEGTVKRQASGQKTSQIWL
jgi:hypothetical protein